MFSQIKKLWRYLCYFFQTRKVWTWPRQSEVLIFDAANLETLLEYLKPWTPEVLHIRQEKINMGSDLLLYLTQCINNINDTKN